MKRPLMAATTACALGALVATQLVVSPGEIGNSHNAADGFAAVEIQPTRFDGDGDPGASLPTTDGPTTDGVYLDVSVSQIRNLTWIGRIGTYPDGRNGFAMSTTSCNVGNVNVPWEAPMDPRHPFIGQNMFRITQGGRLEQIGLAWMKHAFFAADAQGCGVCFPNFNDDQLNVGCQDTYGFSNNSDRHYLGPRSEINPMTAEWDPCGSHFDIGDGSQPDCERSHRGPGHGPIEHLLRVNDADLTDANARYFYECFYIVNDDQNIYNNFRHQEADLTWLGNQWDSTDVGEQIPGTIVMRWGDMHNFTNPATQGDAIVAARVVDLRGGMYRYEYAVLNYTVTRQIGSFEISIGGGVNISNAGFHAPVEEEEGFSNEPWSVTIDSDSIRWATDPHSVDPFANSLRFGTVYTFYFDADVPPDLTTATTSIFQPDPGSATELTASTLGPAGGTPSGIALEASEIHLGQTATLRASGVEPGARVHFAFSPQGIGRAPVPQLGVVVDLEEPLNHLGSRTANAEGVAIFQARVPPGAPTIDIALQALATTTTGPRKSNVIERSIMP